MKLAVAILAGGLAVRLHPATEKLPKALVAVAGRPFIEHQLRRLQREGVRRVVICAGYLGEQILDHVGDGGAFGVEVDYSFDGPALLGTGGALRKARPLLGAEFFVLYGDSYLPIALAPVAEAYAAAGKPALMTVLLNDDRWDRSNVEFSGGLVRRHDKSHSQRSMRYIDYGLGILSAAVLEEWPADRPVDLADVYSRLADRGELAGFEVFERFYEIGSSEGLRETDRYLGSKGEP